VAKIAIIDYGVGNLRSVEKAFAHLGHTAVVTSDANIIQDAERVILPGVGAFGAAASTLRARGLEAVTLAAARSGRPFLGICVGMQLLFDTSEELGTHRGLGLISGSVRRFPTKPGEKIPQIGWNGLLHAKPSPLTDGLNENATVYFVHSFYCDPVDDSSSITRTDFTINYTSAVQLGNIYGCQFHPEKSGKNGLRILDNFARL
jgi:imidazole glycerol-phosphate synthase subunit HisH